MGFSAGLSISLSAQTPMLNSAKFAQVLKPFGGGASLSVRTLDGQEKVALSSQLSMKPASVAKMISTACSLEELGPNFQYETKWGYTGSIQKGVLKGDLVIHAAGDFSFVIEDLKMIAEGIRFIYGIEKIEGNLIFETSAFERPEWQPFEGFEGDEGRSFAAKFTAAPINFNSFAVWAAPSPEGAKVSVVPQESIALNLIQNVQVKPGRLGGSQLKLSYDVQKGKFVLAGAIGSQDEPRAFYRALLSPYESFARLFKYNFQLVGGSWSGKFETKSNPIATTTIWTNKSRALGKLLMDINKLSTNFGAEMILMAATLKARGAPVGPTKAKAFLSDCVKRYGFTESEILLENASGLSRQSHLQTQALTKFLSQLSAKEYYPEYLSSLSILGRDGTTKSRLAASAGRARLKTGSIQGVRTIAGFVQSASGRWYTMAMFLNCSDCNVGAWNQAENEVLRLLIEDTTR